MFYLGEIDRAGPIGPDGGTKANTLHRLKGMGLPVPPGFVITGGKPPRDILGAVERIGGFPVAVRSSGHLEDLQGASFAGQYETYLQVSSPAELTRCIEACMESANSRRVKVYLRSRDLSPEGVGGPSFSVLVQKMVDVRYAGVAFSMDPMDGKEEHFLLEVCSGSGERLVSGHTSPTRYAIAFDTLETVSRHPGDEDIRLSDSRVREIRDRLLEIQSLLRSPQDVEWAIDRGGKLWILQARPITRIRWRTDLGEYTNADFKDGGISSTVCTPMMFSLYRRCFSESMDRYLSSLRLIRRNTHAGWMTRCYGRAYWNVGIIKEALFKIPGFDERHLDQELGIEKGYGAGGPHVTPVNWKTLLRAVPIAIGLRLEYSRCRRMIEGFKKRFESMDRRVRREIDRAVTCTHEEFLSGMERMIERYYVVTETSYFRSLYNNANFQADFKKFLLKMDRRIGGATPLLELMLGLSDISHLRIQEGMVELCRTARTHSRRSPEWQKVFGEFIRRFYFHGDTALDLKTPRWSEAPEIVMSRVDSLLRTGIAPADPEETRKEQRDRYSRALCEVMLRIENGPFLSKRLYRRSFPRMLEQLRNFMVSKEQMREFSTRSYYVVRRFLLEAGRRLVDMGIFREREDVFFLHIEELLDVLRNRRHVQRRTIRGKIDFRRRMYESFKDFTPPNEFGHRPSEGADGGDEEPAEGMNLLKGIGCSPGVYEGPARIVEDLGEVDRIRAGEVLVTRFTDPAWTPVLGMVSAVVTEVGGVLSHAAVISREYGIPAVLNSRGATRFIQTGRRIRVDGDRGTVTLMG
jgi:phosphohistidine swiveling domain-containing protein